MHFWKQYFAVVALLAWPATGEALPPESVDPGAGSTAPSRSLPSARIVASLDDAATRQLVDEVLERNPAVSSAAALARAAARRAPQARALPEPVAGLTAFLLTPETRTGPQRASVAVSQGLPWFGKLELKERAALFSAAAMAAEVEAKRLALVTDARRLHHELAFLTRHREITGELLSHLSRHEEIARSRYATGVGSGQGVVKLQASITRVETGLLDIENRRVSLAAQLNALRDRAASSPLPENVLPEAEENPLDLGALLEAAHLQRPEITAAEARISGAETLIRLADKGYRPDFKVGLTYTMVDPRDDMPGRLAPPPGNGDDILGIQGGITLPLWRRKLAAGVEEAVEGLTAAQEARRGVVAAIDAAIGDLNQRLPLSWRQLRLVEDQLIVQAEEAIQFAQAGYIAGHLNALDLLDAEHVLFEARTAVARATTDYLVGLAQLEGAIGGPLEIQIHTERSES